MYVESPIPKLPGKLRDGRSASQTRELRGLDGVVEGATNRADGSISSLSRWGYAKVKFRKIETNVGYDLTNQRWLVCLALVWESIIAELTRSVSCRNLWFQKENPSFNHSRISYITHAPITNFSDPCFLGKVPALAPSVWRHLQVLNNHRIWYSTMEECKAQEITRKTVLWRILLNIESWITGETPFETLSEAVKGDLETKGEASRSFRSWFAASNADSAPQ